MKLRIPTTMFAALAVTGCMELEDDATSTATASSDLSVLNWSADAVAGGGLTSQMTPGLALAGNLLLAAYPSSDGSDPTYIHAGVKGSANPFFSFHPTRIVPAATTTSHPHLVAFNNFVYMFYSSSVDQYMARYNPANGVWTGSTRLPFNSLGAVSAVVYGGALVLVRVEPSNHRLMMRTMSTSEAFSAEQPVVYDSAASDPCPSFHQPPPFPGGPSIPFPIGGTGLGLTPPASPQTVVAATTDQPVALAAAGACLHIAHRDGSSGTLVYNTFYNGRWGAKRVVTSGAGGAAQTSASAPAMAFFNGVIHMVHVSAAGGFSDTFWTTLENGTWSAPLTVPNHQTYGTPALAVAFNKLWMMHRANAGSGDGIDGTNVWISSFTP